MDKGTNQESNDIYCHHCYGRKKHVYRIYQGEDTSPEIVKKALLKGYLNGELKDRKKSTLGRKEKRTLQEQGQVRKAAGWSVKRNEMKLVTLEWVELWGAQYKRLASTHLTVGVAGIQTQVKDQPQAGYLEGTRKGCT